MQLPDQLLYHYTSGAGLMGIFDNSVLWASSIHSLNDSEEFAHALRVGKEALARAVDAHGHPRGDELAAALAQRLDSSAKLSLFVACFSQVEDSLSQWRGYCPPAFGYCIGFNAAPLRRTAEAQGFDLRPCIYDHSRQRSLADDWAARHVPDLIARLDTADNLFNHVNDNRTGMMREFATFAPFMKHAAFKDEQEWRLVKLVRTDDPQMKLRLGRSMLVKYVTLTLDFQSDAPALVWDVKVGPTPHP